MFVFIRAIGRLVRIHFWALLFTVALLIGSSMVVKSWKAKHPGAMTVLESQAMDMTVMKPPVGAAPVATEIVHAGRFTSTVTYTGSVAPYQEQVVYPRIDGYLKNLSVYNGDSVAAGQLLGTVDSPDLTTKVAEAEAGHAAAEVEITSARIDAVRASAELEAAKGEVQAAQSEVAKARGMVTAAEKAVSGRQQEVKSAQANLDYWQAEIAREEALLKAGAVSQQEYQSERAQATQAETEVKTKQAMVEEARADLEVARTEVGGKQSMLEAARQRAAAAKAAVTGASYEINRMQAMARQAKAMVATASTIGGYRRVTAPFAGVVTTRYISPGQYVNPSTAILTVAQIDRVRLQANVSDKDMAQIKAGAPVTARFAKNASLVLQARVTSISPSSDQSSRTAVVEAVVANPGHELTPGDSVTLEISASGQVGGLSVPAGAIVRKDGADAVWIARSEAAKGEAEYYCTMHPDVVSDKPGKCPKCHMDLVPREGAGGKRAHLVAVTTGGAAGDRIEITSGLSDGDEVIYLGNTYLREGDAVFPTKWTQDGPLELPQAPAMESMPGMPGMKMPGGKQGEESMPGMKMPDEKQGGESMPGMKMPAAPAAKAKPAAALYACPMHPEVTSDKPGQTCPKCGMTLERVR